MIRQRRILFLFLLLVSLTSTVFATDIRIVGKDLVAFDGNGEEIDTLPLEGIPASLAYSPSGELLYVRLANENSIAVFEVKTLQLTDWFSMDRVVKGRRLNPDYWSVDPVGGRLVFLDMNGESVFADEYRDAVRLAEAPSPESPLVTAGSEFDLSELAGAKSNPSVDFDSGGDFAASWTDLGGNDGSGEGVYIREFKANGDPQGGEFRGNSQKGGNQGNTSLAAASSGDYVVVWRDDSGLDGDGWGVFGRRFNKGGSPKDPQEVKLSNSTAGRQKEAAVDSEPDGDFVVVWTGPSGSDKAVFGRRFNANGTPKGSEFVVGTSSNVYAPDVATNSSGRFVIAWRANDDDLVHARLYSSTGAPIGGSFKVDSSAFNQFVPNVAMDESGDFTVAFQSINAGGIMYRQFDSNGSPKGGTRVGGHNGSKEYAPSLSINAGGKFCIAWRDDLLNVWGRAFKSNGDPDGAAFRVSTIEASQFEPNCAIDPDGNLFVSWKYRPGGGNGSIRGRKFDAGGSTSLSVACTANPNEGAPPLNVDFTATASGGTGTYDYAWVFGDGDTITKQNPSHTYNTAGSFDAVVTVTSGSETATCKKTISVGGVPPGDVVVTEITVTKVNRNTPETILSVKGSGFVDGATVSFNDPAVDVFLTNFMNSGRIKIRINVLATAYLGLHDVTVTNPDNKKGTGINLLKVQDHGGYPAPTILTVDPNTVNAGATPTLKITGLDFARDLDALQVDAGAGVTVGSIEWISPTEIHAHTDVDSHAVCGSRDVVVSHGSAHSQPCVDCLFVSSSKVTIGSVSPSSLRVGQGPTELTIVGCGFVAGSTAKIKGTEKISQTVVDSSTILLTVKVKDTTDPGFKRVTVANSIRDVAKRKDVFEVKP